MTTDPVHYFLLARDHRADRLVHQIDFGEDVDSALVAYREMEDAHWDEPWMDIVLIGATSIDSIRVTHRNYFINRSSFEEINRQLAALMS